MEARGHGPPAVSRGARRRPATRPAGLWAGWRDPESEEVRRTFTIVTTPNDAMADLHDRMPVVLEESLWVRWLVDGRAGLPVDEGELLAMLRPTEAVPLMIYPVNRYVNDVRRDGRS